MPSLSSLHRTASRHTMRRIHRSKASITVHLEQMAIHQCRCTCHLRRKGMACRSSHLRCHSNSIHRHSSHLRTDQTRSHINSGRNPAWLHTKAMAWSSMYRQRRRSSQNSTNLLKALCRRMQCRDYRRRLRLRKVKCRTTIRPLECPRWGMRCTIQGSLNSDLGNGSIRIMKSV